MTAIVATPPLRVEEIRTLSEFMQRQAEWDELWARAVVSYPMTSHTWLGSWWKAFGGDLQGHVLLVWQGDVLVGAAPFGVRTTDVLLAQRRVLGLFSNTWVDRSHLLLASLSPAIVDAMLDHLERTRIEFDLIELVPLEESCPQTTLLLECFRRRRWPLGTEEHLQSPFLQLPSSWDELQQNLSSSFRQTLRRKVRKVEAMKNVTMRVIRDSSCLEPIVAVSLETWQQDEGTSMASSEQILAFYRPIIEAAALAGTLECAVMEVDGEPAAFEFNLAHRRTLHNFKLGFKKKFSELSTGIVLKAHLLKEVLDRPLQERLTEYDFMGTAEPYKLNWTKSVRGHNRYYAFRPHWNLRLVHWLLFKAKPWIRSHAPWLTSKLKALRKPRH